MRPGLTKELAAKALERGWRKDSLLELHRLLMLEGTCVDLLPWAFLVDGELLIYKSYGPDDIYNAFKLLVPFDQYIAYCDGSGTTSNKEAGIGCVVYRPGSSPLLYAQHVGPASNNAAELMAIWCALRACPNVQQGLLVRSDSQYALGVLQNLDWTLAANVELIGLMRRDLALRGSKVTFEHCDGHSGIEGNEVADRLANIGRKLVKEITIYER